MAPPEEKRHRSDIAIYLPDVLDWSRYRCPGRTGHQVIHLMRRCARRPIMEMWGKAHGSRACSTAMHDPAAALAHVPVA